MRKLLGKGAAETPSGDPSLSITSAPSSLPAAFRPSKSQNAVYPTNSPILSLDASLDKRAAVLGGPHVLKTVVLEDPSSFNFNFYDGVDIRSSISSQSTGGAKATQAADQLSIRDVKWHGNSTILTACANGKVFAYDIARVGSSASDPVEYIQVQEDSRQINTLDVNPHYRRWILSGSQDGMARVFDTASTVPSRSGGITFRQRFAPLKCMDPVRQVRWSPKVGHEMACCTEGGVVLKWDVRNAGRPLLRIHAHEKACSAIAWHPDGVHLISASSDTRLHVWDLSSTADKRQKPKYTIYAPASVATVAWRPGLWSATAQSKRVAQVAVSYEDSGPRRYGLPTVHIWDLARPTMPYKMIERFDSSPTAMLWQDQDMLWTVGADGLFNQCDVAFAPKVVDRQSTSAMAFSPTGDALMFLDERSHTHRPRPHVTHHPELIPRGNWGSTPNTPMLSISRSDSEEDVVGSFLGPRRRYSRKRMNSVRSAPPLSTTPPSTTNLPDENKELLGLDQAIQLTGTFRSQQAMASGRLPATRTVHTYQYLSSVYLETLERELPFIVSRKPLDERIAAIMEQYAAAAETASLFRLSQTWRILSYAVGLLLKKRSQFHLDTRLGRFTKQKVDEKKTNGKARPSELHATIKTSGDATPRRLSTQANVNTARSYGSRSLLTEEIDSTSNVPTPLARPADAGSGIGQRQLDQVTQKLATASEPDEFALGPSVHGSYKDSPCRKPNSLPKSEVSQTSGRTHHSHHSQVSSTEGYDFYDTDIFEKAVDFPSPKKKVPLSIEATIPSASTGRGVTRHDSNESFGQMFSISDGNKYLTPRTVSQGSGPWKSSLARHASDMERLEESETNVGEEALITSRKRAQVRDSPDEIFMISQTTATTDEMYPSQTTDSLLTDGDSRSEVPRLEVPVIASTVQPSRSSSPVKGPMTGQQDARPYLLETDYLHWDDDPPYPFPTVSPGSQSVISPLDPYTLITRALDFESRSSALNSSAIILLLKPLVPENVIDRFQASGILRQHHSRLVSMGLFVEATLLRNLCIQGWPEGLAEWGDNYMAIFAQAQQGVKVGFLCSSCRKPREIDPKQRESAIWTCERCRAVMAPCAVCGHREPEQAALIPKEISTVKDTKGRIGISQWWYCPGCTHGGHASCLQAWHAPLTDSDPGQSTTYSDGCCPLDGCGHACLPGKYRGETTTARADELGRAAVEKSRSRDERGSRRSSPRPDVDRVKSDNNDVPQSRAVGMARETLSKGGGGGILSSSPGRVAGSSERERRKSVKFASTGR